MVGIFTSLFGNILSVPRGYVSGTALPGMAIYTGKTFATLGVTPGTYIWTWGPGANQNFTLRFASSGIPTPTPTPNPTTPTPITGASTPTPPPPP